MCNLIDQKVLRQKVELQTQCKPKDAMPDRVVDAGQRERGGVPNVGPSRSKVLSMLNVGCGRRIHPDWVNVDLVPFNDSVIGHDISKGLPFADGSFDAVYHSHVLEHLSPEAGRRLLVECHRVLRPGGVLRIVVPNLEQIARLYLAKLDQALIDPDAAADYRWMKLELLDQLVRGESGGQMGQYIASGAAENEDFIRQRIGHEMGLCLANEVVADQPTVTKPNWFKQIKKRWSEFKNTTARRSVKWLLGKDALAAFDEGVFRSQGEVHRWMYDQFSLRELCQSIGFEDFCVRTATESWIDGFESFELDSAGADVRKPDSLFVEVVKPKPAVAYGEFTAGT